MMLGLVEYFEAQGFDRIGAAAQDPDNARVWAAAATGATTTPPTPNGNADIDGLIGVAHFGWGPENEAPLNLLQTGWYLWQSEWALLDTWHLTQDAAAPGGDETGEWTVSGGYSLSQFQGITWIRPFSPGELTWPLEGRKIKGDTFSWESEYLALEPDYVVPIFGVPYDVAGVMTRIYVRPRDFGDPASNCAIGGDYYFTDAVGSWGPIAADVVAGDCMDGLDNDGDTATDGADADCASDAIFEDGSLPDPDALLAIGLRGTSQNVGSRVPTHVSIDIEVSSCGTAADGLEFFNPTLYQSVPSIDFPHPYIEQTLTDWPAAASAVCKDLAPCDTTGEWGRP